MARWKYQLKCGKELRKAIDGGNYKRVINVLDHAYDELLRVGLIDEDDLMQYTEEFVIYDADGLDEDDVNYELGEFYDLCDNVGVWIPLV